MGRRPNPVPAYTLHKSSGQARVWLHGKEVYLGVYNSPESLAAYARIVAEVRASADPAVVSGHARAGVTVDEVLLAFWKFADLHYRRADGTHTHEIVEYRQTYKPLRALYGNTPAAEFGPLALKAVRQRMVDAGLSRKLVNQRVGRVKRIFRWAASEQLVPASVCQAISTVAGLQRNRTAARETEPVRPVAGEHVRATLPHLRPEVAAMVEVQLLTGMRPGEVCRIRPCDIDTAGAVWVFRPPHHKLGYKGKGRAVAIGPRARAILGRFTPANPADYFFSPARAVAALYADRARNRRTPR